MDGRMDKQTDGRTDGWTVGRTALLTIFGCFNFTLFSLNLNAQDHVKTRLESQKQLWPRTHSVTDTITSWAAHHSQKFLFCWEGKIVNNNKFWLNQGSQRGFVPSVQWSLQMLWFKYLMRKYCTHSQYLWKIYSSVDYLTIHELVVQFTAFILLFNCFYCQIYIVLL